MRRSSAASRGNCCPTLVTPLFVLHVLQFTRITPSAQRSFFANALKQILIQQLVSVAGCGGMNPMGDEGRI